MRTGEQLRKGKDSQRRVNGVHRELEKMREEGTGRHHEQEHKNINRRMVEPDSGQCGAQGCEKVKARAEIAAANDGKVFCEIIKNLPKLCIMNHMEERKAGGENAEPANQHSQPQIPVEQTGKGRQKRHRRNEKGDIPAEDHDGAGKADHFEQERFRIGRLVQHQRGDWEAQNAGGPVIQEKPQVLFERFTHGTVFVMRKGPTGEKCEQRYADACGFAKNHGKRRADGNFGDPFGKGVQMMNEHQCDGEPLDGLRGADVEHRCVLCVHVSASWVIVRNRKRTLQQRERG